MQGPFTSSLTICYVLYCPEVVPSGCRDNIAPSIEHLSGHQTAIRHVYMVDGVWREEGRGWGFPGSGALE